MPGLTQVSVVQIFPSPQALSDVHWPHDGLDLTQVSPQESVPVVVWPQAVGFGALQVMEETLPPQVPQASKVLVLPQALSHPEGAEQFG